MIHYNLHPLSSCTKSTFNSICICCTAKSLPVCLYPFLKPNVPTNANRDHRFGLSCSQWIMRCGVRQKGRERTKALKFLMKSLVFSLLNLYTSCLQAGWSYQHTTLHKPTSCHPWHHHTIWCAITAGMFPELDFHICVATWGTSTQVVFFFFLTCLYLTHYFVLSLECWQGAVVKEKLSS